MALKQNSFKVGNIKVINTNMTYDKINKTYNKFKECLIENEVINCNSLKFYLKKH